MYLTCPVMAGNGCSLYETAFALVTLVVAAATTGCSVHPSPNCVGEYGVIRMFPTNGAVVASGPVDFWTEIASEDEWETYGYVQGYLVITSDGDDPIRLWVDVTHEEGAMTVDLEEGLYVWWFEGRFEQLYGSTTECLFPPHVLVVQDAIGELH